MAYQDLGLGTTADDGTGDTLRAGGDKINDNFVELYTLLGTGTALSSGISSTATVITLASPAITGTISSATITTLTSTNIRVGDGGNVGSASDTDAIAISAAGVVSLSATTEASATGTAALTLAGGIGVAKDMWIGDDIVLDSDSAVIKFGDSQEIEVTHVADTGLILKHTATGDGTPIKLTMQTGENALTVGEQLGVIDF